MANQKPASEGRHVRIFSLGDIPAYVSENGLLVGNRTIPPDVLEPIIAAYQEARAKAERNKPQEITLATFLGWAVDAGLWMGSGVWIAVYDSAYTVMETDTGATERGLDRDRAAGEALRLGIDGDAPGLAWNW